MAGKKSVDELLAASEKKTSELKLRQANEKLGGVEEARKQLEESRKKLEAERHNLRRQIAVGGMVLSWVNDATENMSPEELKSKLEEYLSVDTDVTNGVALIAELDSIIAENAEDNDN